MEFDPVGSAQSIPDMIKNDTLIEVLDQDQLCECLKHITLNVDDSLYILDRVRSKYKVPDRFKAVRHLLADFGEGDKFDSKKFVGFIKSLCQCLHLDILDSIAAIVESAFSKIEQMTPEIKQNSQKTAIKPDIRAQTQQTSTSQTQAQQESTPQTQNQAANKNIEELKKIPKTEENFDKIYKICKRIAREKDKEAMSFAVREKFVYVTGSFNILTKAVFRYKEFLVDFLIESGIDINCKDKSNETALTEASSMNRTSIVKTLLAVPGIDVNSVALYRALVRNNIEIVKLLLAVPGIDVNTLDSNNSTLLIWALCNDRHEAAKLLLTVPGIDVNAKNKDNQTALTIASKMGYHEIVKRILAVPGIDVNAKGVGNKTALFWAQHFGHHEIVKMLKSHDAI